MTGIHEVAVRGRTVAKTMSQEHKDALAVGRARSKAVKAYLEALEEIRPKRGRKRTPDTIRARLDKIEAEVPDAPVLKRLELSQETKNLQVELERLETYTGPDLTALEADFIKVAADYGQTKGISYSTWRDFGIEAATLKQAGITRSR